MEENKLYRSNNFVTVLTVSQEQDLWAVRALLESQDIECKIANEYTAQMAPVYANAIGGVRLQIHESDLNRAVNILIQAGYLHERDLEASKPIFDIDTITTKYPIVKKKGFKLVFFLSIILLVVAAAGMVYYASLPSTYERLVKNDWCLVRVNYKGKDYTPDSNNAYGNGLFGLCKESISFHRDGTVYMPGFKSNIALGKWELRDEMLHITDIDTFAFVYDGVYEIDFSRSNLDLQSSHTSLHCYEREVEF